MDDFFHFKIEYFVVKLSEFCAFGESTNFKINDIIIEHD